jgi:hypothetical protein
MATEDFTVRDAVAWLGLTWDAYVEAEDTSRDYHGGPMNSAILAARDAQGTDITPAEVLARFGIDPANPTAAQKRYMRERDGLPVNQRGLLSSEES